MRQRIADRDAALKEHQRLSPRRKKRGPGNEQRKKNRAAIKSKQEFKTWLMQKRERWSGALLPKFLPSIRTPA
jgi:hypothetical protein